MDELHSALVRLPTSQTFFDPWHQHNQFLSEWAFHRSLLASALVTTDPRSADFFFVPFYSRLAYETRKATDATQKVFQRRMLKALYRGLQASPFWQRSGGRDHLFVVSSTRAMEQLFKELAPLVAPAILLKIELGDTRRKSDRRRANHVALPYYVPWLPRDETTQRKADRRFSVCLEASGHGGKVGKARAALMQALKAYPKAMIRMADPQRLNRNLLCGSRRRMRACKFCVVPKGITPSSRRFYEALAAKCIPIVISDRFVVPFEGTAAAAAGGSGSAGAGLLPPHAIDSFVLRVPEDDVERLPAILGDALPRHDTMMRQLLAYRTAYLYEMPLDGQPFAGGAVCAVVAEVARRFGPFLAQWRRANATTVGTGSQLHPAQHLR